MLPLPCSPTAISVKKFQDLFKKFLRFLSGGGAVWALRAGMTSLLTELAGLNPVLVYQLGLVISFFLYFFLNVHFIFQVSDHRVSRFLKYTALSVSLLTVDGKLMEFLTDSWGWHYFISLSISTGILLVFKFFLYHFLVFHPSSDKAV